MQAIILAAGMGKRLKELTSNATKCMVEVNGVTMIEKTLGHLEKLGLKRIVFVIGYEGQKLKSYVESLNIKTPLEFIDNDVYYKTNNIYSLYLAKEKLTEDDTLLLESDLVYEEAVIRKLVDHPYPSLTLVDKFESWMDGTCVTLDEDDNITAFLSKREFDFSKTDEYYKTVNLYKFSKEFSQKHYVPFLEAYCKALGTNEYYEQVLKVITFLDDPQIKAVKLNGEKWYEIDDVQDLDIAETLFATKSGIDTVAIIFWTFIFLSQPLLDSTIFIGNNKSAVVGMTIRMRKKSNQAAMLLMKRYESIEIHIEHCISIQ